MAETPKVYVICDQNCKFESMTKEQILTAIAQAVNDGTISNIDAGFIQTIKTINNVPLRFFVGTQAEYETLTDEDKNNLFAIITNDAIKEQLFNIFDELKEKDESIINALNEIVRRLGNGNFEVKKATIAKKLESTGEYREYTSGTTIFESGTYEFRINYGGTIYCSILSIVASGSMAVNSRAIVFYTNSTKYEFSIRYDGTFKLIKEYYSEGWHEEDVTNGDGEANVTINYRRIL